MADAESEPYGRPTMLEKIGLVPTILRAALIGLYTLLLAPFNDNFGANSIGKIFMCTVFREYSNECTTRTIQWMNAPTDQMYLKLAKLQAFQPDSDVLADDAKGHWIGKKNAKYVLMYLHGGAYSRPLSDVHKEWLWDLYQTMTKNGHDFAIVVLSYTLAPQAKYPTQLRQAVTLLRHLIEDQKKDSANILVGGDSAGGHLTLLLLSHLLHPHPSGIPKLSLSSPLMGAILISPWTTFRTTANSWTKNQYSDMFSITANNRGAYNFVGKAPRDNYLDPLLAPDDWYTGLEEAVKSIYIWCGGREVLADPIRDCETMLKKVHGDTTMITEPRSCHVEMIIDCCLRLPKPPGQLALESWMQKKM